MDCDDLFESTFNKTNDTNNISMTMEESFDQEQSLVNSAKKVKISKEERHLLKLQKEAEKDRKKQEREKQKLEREKQKMEREKKLLEERDKKLKELQEKRLSLEREKDAKQRQRQEEQEKRERLKKEKEEEKQRYRETKEKERQEKQAQIDEAKRKEEMEIKLKEAKLAKQQAVLFNFLKKSSKSFELNNQNLNISIDSDASISNVQNCNEPNGPVVPEKLLDSFDSKLFYEEISKQKKDDEANLYLESLLSGRKKPFIMSKNNDDEQDIVQLPQQYRDIRFIFLKFHENVKPSYFGPRPSSTLINGRRPFAKELSLDYDLDSDEEWDEGGPGESLSSSGESEPENDKEDYEIDNDFFVPHGYLSDDEFNGESAIFNSETDPNKKSGPLLKEQTLMAERNRRFNEQLKPQVIGCLWFNQTNKEQFKEKYEFLEKFKAVVLPKPMNTNKQ